MRTLFALLTLATAAFAADVRFTWLPTETNVVGAPATYTDVTYYGVQVFMDSDNPQVSEFTITLVYRNSAGEIRTATATVPRAAKAQDVKYSTGWVAWVDTASNFEVLSVEVKATTRKPVTQPIAGRDYTTEDK
jgi:hypothetical protein